LHTCSSKAKLALSAITFYFLCAAATSGMTTKTAAAPYKLADQYEHRHHEHILPGASSTLLWRRMKQRTGCIAAATDGESSTFAANQPSGFNFCTSPPQQQQQQQQRQQGEQQQQQQRQQQQRENRDFKHMIMHPALPPMTEV
jgi:hypothetical protein